MDALSRALGLVEQWIDEALGSPGFRLAEFPRAVAIDAGLILREAISDPLDRILAATARHLDATLITADDPVLQYGRRTGNVRVQDLRR